jgi:hypothetical protein
MVRIIPTSPTRVKRAERAMAAGRLQSRARGCAGETEPGRAMGPGIRI